eukprot:2873961-Amphidinium_carterae.1
MRSNKTKPELVRLVTQDWTLDNVGETYTVCMRRDLAAQRAAMDPGHTGGTQGLINGCKTVHSS